MLKHQFQADFPSEIPSGLRGGFRFFLEGQEGFVWNNILDEGEIAFLKMIAQADDTVIANSAGNFYIGLCDDFVDDTTTLADGLTGEPTNAGGYARQAVARSSVGWPTTQQNNGVWRIVTDVVNFIATGADYSKTIQRAFLTNVLNGSAGKLLAVGGALPTPVLIVNGQSFPMQYELYLA